MQRQRSSQAFSRNAFTLVELLVVIAIIGVLVGLLLPAIQAARGAAHRMQCTNNLKQIGIALHSYHTALGSFPISIAGVGKTAPGQALTGLYSWQALLLPFLEQDPLHRQINFQVNNASSTTAYNPRINADHPNAAAARTVVPTFLCPSDSFIELETMGTARSAGSNYTGNAGWPPYATGIDGTRRVPAQHNGFMGLTSPNPASWHTGATTAAQFTDGLSNTIAVTERLISSYESAADIESGDPRIVSLCGSSAGTKRTLDGYYEEVQYSHMDLSYSKLVGRAWISGSALVGNTYLHALPMNKFNVHVYDGELDGQVMISPSSQHSGGVHVLMGDGRVQFVSEQIDKLIWWSIGSRNGNEVTTEVP
ncbi:MAG: DUF1559 domain-containing protein [Pirellulales bacterium]|nr:DUF1559 domain-containing protein [Pirellulales bacterium]